MKKIIHTSSAPAAVGPYSQATEINGTVFVSGQIAIDPGTNRFDILMKVEDQTERVMQNLHAILVAAGCTFDDVVKCEIFCTNLDHFKAINDIYRSYFSDNPPARQTIEVKGLPLGAQVEISCIAVKQS